MEDKFVAALTVFHVDDGGMPQKSAEVGVFTGHFAGDGNQPACRGLVVDHADGHLIGDDAGQGLFGGSPGDGNHVQAH